MPGKGLGIFSPPAEGSCFPFYHTSFLSARNSPSPPFQAKRKPLHKRVKGRGGFGLAVTTGPKGKLPTAMVSSAFLPPISSPLFLSKGGWGIIAKRWFS
jgi:hypothetical protein